MKKSIKGLVLGLLATLAAFALVYAKPMVAQAGSYSETRTEEVDVYEYVELFDENGENYGGNEWVRRDEASVSMYFSWTGHDSEEDGLLDYDFGSPMWVELDFVNGKLYLYCDLQFIETDFEATGTFSYNVIYNGINYLGTASLICDDIDDCDYENGYLWIELILTSDSNEAEGYYKSINDLKDMIRIISNDSSLTGENRVIEFAEGDALPKDVIAALANSTGVTLKFTFVYKGFEFCSTITSEDAKRIYDPAIEWYGPCFLAENVPTVWTGKTV